MDQQWWQEDDQAGWLPEICNTVMSFCRCWLCQWTCVKLKPEFVLALEGPDSFALLAWNAKRQRAVRPSTTEAEFVSLSAALFNEAIPILQVVQLVFSDSISLRCFEDNQAVLAILAKGYSPKTSPSQQIPQNQHCLHMPSVWGTLHWGRIDTKKQRADIMIKALPIGQWASALDFLRIIDLKPSWD